MGRGDRDHRRRLAETMPGQVLVVAAGRAPVRADDTSYDFRPTAPSHHLGLDVHDCSDLPQPDYQDAVLEPGMVLTVEPGLYFHAFDELAPPELRDLGLRSEDELLVTTDGAENLSAALPLDVDELQAWMRAQAGRR